MQIFIGQNDLGGEFSRYSARFQVLEVLSDARKLPKPSRLRAWRDQAPAGFVFSVVLPQSVAALDSAQQEDLDRALEAVSCLRAEWIVLCTPSSVRPSARSEEKIGQLVERLRQATPVINGNAPRIAWQPAGLWEPQRAERLANQLGISLIRDLCREDAPKTDTLYTRIRTLGTSSRLGPGLVQKLLERLLHAATCVVVVEGRSGEHLQKLIKAELAQLAEDEELEDDADEDDADEDDADEDDADEDDADEDDADEDDADEDDADEDDDERESKN